MLELKSKPNYIQELKPKPNTTELSCNHNLCPLKSEIF